VKTHSLHYFFPAEEIARQVHRAAPRTTKTVRNGTGCREAETTSHQILSKLEKGFDPRYPPLCSKTRRTQSLYPKTIKENNKATTYKIGMQLRTYI